MQNGPFDGRKISGKTRGHFLVNFDINKFAEYYADGVGDSSYYTGFFLRDDLTPRELANAHTAKDLEIA
jgi:hypothetical protein